MNADQELWTTLYYSISIEREDDGNIVSVAAGIV
jgi:hypothetical protein